MSLIYDDVFVYLPHHRVICVATAVGICFSLSWLSVRDLAPLKDNPLESSRWHLAPVAVLGFHFGGHWGSDTFIWGEGAHN